MKPISRRNLSVPTVVEHEQAERSSAVHPPPNRGNPTRPFHSRLKHPKVRLEERQGELLPTLRWDVKPLLREYLIEQGAHDLRVLETQ